MSKENEAYAGLLCGHLQGFTHRLRQMSPEHWDWTPDVAAPTARTLATHTWQWLNCDRQHINEPDASLHPHVPEPPEDPQAMCDALEEETKNWHTLIMGLTPEQLDSPRHQFNIEQAAMTVRGFICHMIQNTIYKHGQFSTLYFALGYDGKEPYTAPFPNPIYDEVFGRVAREE